LQLKIGMMFASMTYTTADECREAARVAEEVGLDSVWAVEHVLTPKVVTSPYPYTSDGKLSDIHQAVLCDPVVWLAFMAACSTTLRLGTGIMILPQRNPAYVAKEWATLDRLSDGRAMLGVGIGWLAEEMEAVGVPFGERAPRTEEMIHAIRSLWSNEFSTFDGRWYRWSEMNSNPKPVQQPGVPIVIGGHAPAAARRAARLGDGFFLPGQLSRRIGSDLGDLAALLDTMRAECALIGRDPSTIEVTIGADRPDSDLLAQLEELGVHRVVVPAPRPDALRRRLEPLAAFTGN
jgi:probable F420-dependent oxidoreductase